MSVPVVVTVHGNQQCDAEATIFWENAFSEKVCHIPEHIQLTSKKATGWLQLPDRNGKLFLISTHRSLPRFLRVQLFSNYWIRLSYDVKNYAAREGCYPPQLKAEVDSILRDLHNSSHHTKADCLIIHSKYFSVLNKPTSSQNSGVFLGTVSGCKQMFFLADTSKK